MMTSQEEGGAREGGPKGAGMCCGLGALEQSVSGELRALDDRIADLWIRYDAVLHTDNDVFVPTDDRLDHMASETVALRRDLALQSPQGAWEDVILHHATNLAEALAFRLVDERATPHRYLADVGYTLDRFLLLDGRSRRQKDGILATKLEGVADLVDAVCERTSQVGPAARKAVTEYLGTLLRAVGEYMPDHGAGDPGVSTALRLVEGSLEGAMDTIAGMSGKGEVQTLPYRLRLKTLWDIDADEMLRWCDEALIQSRDRFLKLARTRLGRKSMTDYVQADDGSLGSPEEAIALMRQFLGRAREASSEHIRLPAGETCDVLPVPPHMEKTYPWGGCMSPSPLSHHLRGAVLVNTSNYRNLSPGWLQMLALHECYPGHHAQRVKISASDLPRSFKVHTLSHPSSPLVEGIAHRSETLLAEVFGPSFEVFAAYRRLHTITRIRADLSLHMLGHSPEEVVHLYRETLGLSAGVARGQVHFQELLPGYMTTYYYGLRWLQEMTSRLSLDDRILSEWLFSAGYVGLGTLENVIKMHLARDESRAAEDHQRKDGGTVGTPRI